MIEIVKRIEEANCITHSGTMHADEVFSTAFLELYLKDIEKKYKFLDDYVSNVNNQVNSILEAKTTNICLASSGLRIPMCWP